MLFQTLWNKQLCRTIIYPNLSFNFLSVDLLDGKPILGPIPRREVPTLSFSTQYIICGIIVRCRLLLCTFLLFIDYFIPSLWFFIFSMLLSWSTNTNFIYCFFFLYSRIFSGSTGGPCSSGIIVEVVGSVAVVLTPSPPSWAASPSSLPSSTITILLHV